VTYRQYYIKLIKDLYRSESLNKGYYQMIKGEKDFLDKDGMAAYKHIEIYLTTLMNRCDRINELLQSNKVKLNDIIDPDVLGFLPAEN
jgi:cobalamin-dependent methionine synthase I